MMVRMPIAPTSSEIPAIAADRHRDRCPITRPKVSSISVWVVMVKSSSPRWRGGEHRADPRPRRAGMRLGAGGDHVDLHQLVEVEQVHRGGHRHVGGVVEVEAEELPLRLHDADHQEATGRRSAPAGRAADSAPKISRASLGPSTRRARPGGGIHRRQEGALADAELPGLRHLVADAVDEDAAAAVAALDPRLADDHRDHALHPGNATQGLGVVDGELVGGAAEHARACPMVLILPGLTASRLVPNWVNWPTM